MVKLSEILSIYKENEVDQFLKLYSHFDLTERSLSYADIKSNWKFLGGNESNGSTVNLLKNGEKGLVERLTNAIDAVIEKQKEDHRIVSAQTSNVIIKKAFPHFYSNNERISKGEADQLSIKDAFDQVILAVNDGSKSNKPTFDVIDRGTGIAGEDFSSTILSIAHGNKLSKEKSYLIGAFGQGGSTSIAFTYSTLVLSKKNGKYYFTYIKSVDLQEYKNIVYVYLTDEHGAIIEVEDDNPEDIDDYLRVLLDSESGTLIRMIETDISKRFRDNEVTKPGMLGDYINSELFNVGLPVKIIDNRISYRSNSSNQNRYAYGSFLKLQTSKYLKKDYCGSISIIHNDRSYKIDYYILLPRDEAKWGIESECKHVFEQFNVSYDPIIYTVNGQMITSERYTKLNNAGLNFLRYRLLVVINLDVLGTEKYKFFTSDRAQIQNTDLTRGFLDKIIVELANVDKLKEINTIIAEKSINSSIDRSLLDEVSKEVKNQYARFLKAGGLLPSSHDHGHHNNPTPEEIYEDKITQLEITSAKDRFYKDQTVTSTVTTGAQKHINQEALIYMYIDGKNFYDFTKNVMNGRILYTISAGKILPGDHTIQFQYFSLGNGRDSFLTECKEFTVINEKTPESAKKEPDKVLDLDIVVKDEATLICDIAKETVTKKVTVYLCFDTDELRSEVYGHQKSADEIAVIKNKLIRPVALFGLFYSEYYDKLDTDEAKNRLILTFIKTFVLTNNVKEM